MGGGFKEHKSEILAAAALAGLGIATGGFGLAAAAPAAAGAAGGAAGGIGGGTAAGMMGAGAAGASPMAASLMAPAAATPFVTEAAAAGGAMGPTAAATMQGGAPAMAQLMAGAPAGMGAPPAVGGMQRFAAAMNKARPLMQAARMGQQPQQSGPPSPRQTNAPAGPAPSYADVMSGGGLFSGPGELERMKRLALLRSMGGA